MGLGISMGARAAAGASVPPQLSFVGRQHDGSSLSTYTFNSVSFGAASATRIIAVAFMAGGPPSNIATSVTIGGVAATIVQNNRMAAGTVLTLAYAVVPTGTSGSISITYPSAASGGGCIAEVYRIDGMASSVPTSSLDNATPFSLSVTCPANSAVIAACTQYISGSGVTAWSGTAGVVEDDDFDAGNLTGSSASVLTSGALSGATVVATPTTNNAAQMGLMVFS